jgi:hypothetical protein
MLADTPYNWPEPAPMSTLQAILVFGGIPLVAILVISMLVVAPSLAKGPRNQPGRDWDAEPVQFGALPGRSTEPGRELETGPAVSNREQATGGPRDRRGPADDDDTTGGASVTW